MSAASLQNEALAVQLKMVSVQLANVSEQLVDLLHVTMEDAQSAQKRAKERQEHVEALHSQHAEDKAHLEREKAEVLAARYAASLQNEALAAQLQTVSAQLVMPVLFGLPLDRQTFFFFRQSEVKRVATTSSYLVFRLSLKYPPVCLWLHLSRSVLRQPSYTDMCTFSDIVRFNVVCCAWPYVQVRSPRNNLEQVSILYQFPCISASLHSLVRRVGLPGRIGRRRFG